MRVVYIPEGTNFWLSSFEDIDQQGDGNLAAFVGYPYQRGAGIGSFFRSLFRMAVPVLKRVAKTVGKQALITGANIASEAIQTGELLPALEKHGKAGASAALKDVATLIETGGQEGNGLGKRKLRRSAKGVKTNIKGSKRTNKRRKQPIDALD